MPSGWWAPSSLWARALGALSGSPARHVFSLLLAPIAPGMGVLSPELLGTPPSPSEERSCFGPCGLGTAGPFVSRTTCSASGAFPEPSQAPSSSPCPWFKPLSPPEGPLQSFLTSLHGPPSAAARVPQIRAQTLRLARCHPAHPALPHFIVCSPLASSGLLEPSKLHPALEHWL